MFSVCVLGGVARAEQPVDTLPLEDQGEPDLETYDEITPEENSVPKDIDEPEVPEQADEPAESPLVLVKPSVPIADELINVDQEVADCKYTRPQLHMK